METLRNYIAGRYTNSSDLGTKLDPSTAGRLSTYPQSTGDEVRAGVQAAGSALDSWAGLPAAERARFLGAAADWLVQQYGEEGKPSALKTLIMSEVGKPLPEADIEVLETSDFLRYFSDNPSVLDSRALELDTNLWGTKRGMVHFDPVGVIAIIKPWNYPLELIAWSLAPALLAGNTVVIKPSENSPAVGDAYARMASEIGLPPGVINVVHGDGRSGAELTANPGIDMVSFTGSVRSGRKIAEICGRSLKRVTLELGGNDAALILDDADLELAANGVVWGAFSNAGQVCVGVKRVYVARSVLKSFTNLVLERTSALRLGTDVGPIISREQLELVLQFVEDARHAGARALTGGRVKNGPGYFFEPTVLTDIPAGTRLLKEECFGPLLPIIPVDDDTAAVAAANQSDYGLGCSIWTTDLDRGLRLARLVRAGMIWVNDVNVAFPQAPWGGRGISGIGFELSRDGILEYTVRRHISLETGVDKRRAWWYPY